MASAAAHVNNVIIEEREIQKCYWKEHSVDLTLEAMMLDSKASDLDKEERPEVLSLLPPYDGKSVVELGAGIGRFTGELAQKAGQLIALDFIEDVIRKNEKMNGHYKNVKFMCADVMSPGLNISDESVDLIFSNWLLISQDDKDFQKFLDNVQYKCSGILRYERVFGPGYVSTGGFETTKEFVEKLELKPGQRVLDVGCGIGGGDFYMAENFDVEVVGIDLSVNMISLALERATGLKCSVEFEVADCTKKTYPHNSFDVIYSRDTILHIQDKPALFKSFFKWLKPGGKVLISDYCKSTRTPSIEFSNYIKQRGYDLHDVEAYGQMLKDAGFEDVIAEDRTDLFIAVLQRELDVVEKEKDEFISDFSKGPRSDRSLRTGSRFRSESGSRIWDQGPGFEFGLDPSTGWGQGRVEGWGHDQFWVGVGAGVGARRENSLTEDLVAFPEVELPLKDLDFIIITCFSFLFLFSIVILCFFNSDSTIMAAVDNAKVLEQEREIQKNYWMEHSADLTVEAMMLDSKASDLDKEERPEVLSLLPPYEGKSVIELGAGIGRFTGELAQKAGHLLAMDFIESAIKKNEEINGHYKNVEFRCADVTSPDLDIPEGSVDLIFSNWLLMYLSDEEVENLAERMVKWLKVGGFIFFRESCFHQSGDSKRKYNPTHYREPRFYTKIFKECQTTDGSGNSFELSLVGCKCIGAYVRNKKNQNQICWTWQKVSSQDDRGFQQFLDTVQYKCTGILRYERVFGSGYVSTGGIETTKEFVAKLDLKPGQRVLDVGCGIGGGDFYMAETFDVEVVGIDLSVNMISLALERAIGLNCSVEFEVADCTTKTYPDNSFDVIYSRDTILHIQDKPSLFKSFFKWLKPGGTVLISDYCKSSGTPTSEFASYIKQRGYDLHDVEEYGQMLSNAGFKEVIAEDRTEQFLQVLQRELDVLEKEKDEFINDFSEEDYNDIVNGWKAKLIRSSSGEQTWGLFIAKKNKE
ncbi:hypothetical protein G4B88_026544 [Cannabis sativa]|uniref:phosphoethanolamine N-methyltransferase n=1 Tax=Cannabis sativa TaxID=3483 RepID=A0A7J6GR25_CANSA|nr:hypothetical protein G4B88_026544 [Cannabis sativa]